MNPQGPIGMRIALRFDLTLELLDVVTSRVPALLYIRLVRVKVAAVRMVIIGFHILPLRKPALDRARSQTNSRGQSL